MGNATGTRAATPAAWSRAVQVNFQPYRPINPYERELLQRHMEAEARSLMEHWRKSERPGHVVEIAP